VTLGAARAGATGPAAVRAATFAELDARTVYQLLRLRVDVFVVEQDCPYPELDGRDLEESTVHVFTADDAGVTAYLRVLDDGAEARIGRVCTRSDRRGAGLAAELMQAALRHAGDRPVVLAAQSPLAGWYARFGFSPDGAEFVEDGIAHLPMRRAAPPV
jgi:ElaA protein